MVPSTFLHSNVSDDAPTPTRLSYPHLPPRLRLALCQLSPRAPTMGPGSASTTRCASSGATSRCTPCSGTWPRRCDEGDKPLPSVDRIVGGDRSYSSCVVLLLHKSCLTLLPGSSPLHIHSTGDGSIPHRARGCRGPKCGPADAGQLPQPGVKG